MAEQNSKKMPQKNKLDNKNFHETRSIENGNEQQQIETNIFFIKKILHNIFDGTR